MSGLVHARDYSAVSWRLLRQAGVFGPDASSTLFCAALPARSPS
jgi:hypothetical protein